MVGVRDAAKHPQMHRTVPMTQNYLDQNVTMPGLRNHGVGGGVVVTTWEGAPPESVEEFHSGTDRIVQVVLSCGTNQHRVRLGRETNLEIIWGLDNY